jgi:Tol biopolymer transport system component
MATPVPTETTLERPVGIFVVNADGSGLRQVWDGDAVAQSWSPDGRVIAFADRLAPTHDVILLDLDTGAARDLGPSTPSAITWSPDGTSLLVTASGGGPDPTTSRFLETIDVTTGERKRLTAGIYGEWSPDGTRVAFSGPECQRRFDWRALDLATGDITDVLPAYPDATAFISPDWNRIAYFKELPPADVPDAGAPLYVADFDGSNERVLPTGPLRYAWPSWSPDGMWLTYSADPETQRPYLVSSDGSAPPIALADSGYVYGWSVDSSTLVVNGDEGITLYRLAGGERSPVWDTPAYDVEWSPDGTRLGFVAPAPGQDRADLDVYDLGTQAVKKLSDAPLYAASPVWSPDGRRIAFLSIIGGYGYGICE